MRFIHRSSQMKRCYSGRYWRRRKSRFDLVPIFSRSRRVKKSISIRSSSYTNNNEVKIDAITTETKKLPDDNPDALSRSEAQLEFLRAFIKNHPFNLDQLMTIKDAIEDRFVKMDIISAVPYEIALYIMSFLSAKDLCEAAQTCRSWRTVCEDNRLWREKCNEDGLLNDEESLDILFKKRIVAGRECHMSFLKRNLPSPKQETSTPIKRHEWKIAFFKHMNILRNWQTREFKISDSFLAIREQQHHHHNQQQQQQQPIIPANNYPANNLLLARYIHLQHQQQQQQQQDRPPPPLPESASLQQHCPSPSNSPLSESSFASRISSNTVNHLMQIRCHEGFLITCLQYNPRTNTIVSGSDDRTLKVWNSETGQCINTLEGHEGGVWSLQLSKDDIVISGSVDRTLRVWNAHNGELMHTLYGHSSTVRCLALDGHCVVSGSRDKYLRLWDIIEGKCIEVFSGHNAPIRCVEYKNNIIVSGAYDSLVMVWDAVSKCRLHTLEFHRDKIYSLQFDGKTIASGSIDTTICIWDAVKGTLRHHLVGHTSLTSEMKLKGNFLVSANADSCCKVWDIKTGKCIHTLSGEHKHKSAITSVYVNNNHIVTSSDDGTVKLWDFKTGDFIKDLVVLPTASEDGVVWRIIASYTKLICAVGSRGGFKDSHLLVLDFNA